MEYMDKKLEDIVVTLPFADGTSVDCGVFASFTIDVNEYFALLPLTEDKKLDFTQSYMLYRVEKDEEDNPVVVYIESDLEYNIPAAYFARNYLEKE